MSVIERLFSALTNCCVERWQIEQELGRLYERTKTGSRKEKEILRFAEANNLMIFIPE